VSVRGAPAIARVSWAWLVLVALSSAASACAALAVVVSTLAHYAVVFAITGAVLSLGNALIAVDALMAENRLQISLASLWCAMAALFLVYCAVDPGGLGEMWEDVRWYVVGVGAGPGLLQVLLAPMAVASQRYLTYRVAGATPLMQRQYDLFRSVLCLLKLDLMATLVVLALAFTLLEPSGFSWAQVGVSVAALVLSFSLAWAGWAALVNESSAVVVLFCLASLGQPALMAWKLWLLHDHPASFAPGVTFLSLGPACGVALLIRAALLGYMVASWRGFGLGLKEVAFAPAKRRMQHAVRRRLSSAASVLSLNGATAHRAQPLMLPGDEEEDGYDTERRAAIGDDRMLGPSDTDSWH